MMRMAPTAIKVRWVTVTAGASPRASRPRSRERLPPWQPRWRIIARTRSMLILHLSRARFVTAPPVCTTSALTEAPEYDDDLLVEALGLLARGMRRCSCRCRWALRSPRNTRLHRVTGIGVILRSTSDV